MRQWEEFTTEEKFLGVLNELHNLRRRCDEQAAMIGVQREVIENIIGSLANYKFAHEQMLIAQLAVQNVMLENGAMDIGQFRRCFARAAFAHDQISAALRDGDNPMEDQNA